MPPPSSAVNSATPAMPPATPSAYSGIFCARENVPGIPEARRNVEPTHVQPAATSPVRPASGPTDPPKAMGSKNDTLLGTMRPVE